MKFLVNFFFTLLVFVFLFLGLEIFFRATHLFGARISWSIPDPVLGWRFMPNGHFQNFKENDHPVDWTTNRYGWKDEDWAVQKPANVYRVALLGDSFVEGLQVETGRHFQTLAQNALDSTSGMKFEFMNFGRSGFTQSEELLVLQKDVLPFAPDAVALFFFPPNDIADVRKETSPDMIRPFFTGDQLELDTSFKDSRAFKLKSLIAPLKHRSVFISFLTERLTLYRDLMRVKKIRSSADFSGGKLLPYLTLATQNPDAAFSQNYALNKKLIREMAGLCKARSIRFILVNIPTPAYLPAVEARYKTLDASFDAGFFERDLKAFADSLGIEFLGLQEVFRNAYLAGGKDLNWKFEGNPEDPMEIGHWNYEGHGLVAQELEKTISSFQTAAQ